MSEKEQTVPGNPGRIIRIDEAEVESLLSRKVRESVEEALNGLLDAEADGLCGSGPLRAQRRASKGAGVTFQQNDLELLPFLSVHSQS